MDFSANATTIMRTKMQPSTKSDKLPEPLVVKLTIRIPKTPSKTTQQKKKMRHMLKHLHLHRMYWTSWPLLSLHFSHLWCPTIHKLFEKRACKTYLLLMTHPGFLSREECFPNLKICDWMKNKYEIIIYYGKQQSSCVSMVKNIRMLLLIFCIVDNTAVSCFSWIATSNVANKNFESSNWNSELYLFSFLKYTCYARFSNHLKLLTCHRILWKYSPRSWSSYLVRQKPWLLWKFFKIFFFECMFQNNHFPTSWVG